MSWKKYLDYDFENDINDSEREARDKAVEEDLVKVKSIIEGCDIKSSKDANRLYLLVKEYKITFKTEKVREYFLKYLADTAARNREEESERNLKANKKLNKQKIFLTILGCILIIASVGIFVYNYQSRKNAALSRENMNNLQQMHNAAQESSASEEGLKSDEAGSDSQGDGGDDGLGISDDGSGNIGDNHRYSSQSDTILPELAEMFRINSQLAGWVNIPGTVVDYPVLKGGDNDYYLKKGFYNEYNPNGSIFMDYRNSYNDINMIIYGHNTSDGEMFSCLTQYMDENFYKNHREIKFDTLYGHYTYRVIAACLGEVKYIDEEGFRYYNYTDDEYELDSFFMDIRNQSLYPVDYEFKNDDRFITLSTCSKVSENGRLYIVAVRQD
ncbi:MAG: class B sortase [Lachnospira sp.]